MNIKKVEFNERPQFIENEGNVVRINFDIEETTRSVENGEEQTVVLAYAVRVEQPLTEERVKQAIVAAGFEDFKADEIAALVMMEIMQGNGNDAGALAYAKKAVVARINQYDVSPAVNQFTLDGNPMWLDRELRRTLRQRFDDEKEEGAETTNLVYGDQAISLPIDTAITLIKQLDRYARISYDQTAIHKAAVLALDDIEDVMAYDFTTGYEPNPEF